MARSGGCPCPHPRAPTEPTTQCDVGGVCWERGRIGAGAVGAESVVAGGVRVCGCGVGLVWSGALASVEWM